jgi:hypothetical protein
MRKAHMKAYRILLALTIAGTLGAPGAFAGQQGRARGHAKAKAAKDAKDKDDKDKDKKNDKGHSERAVRFDRMDRDHDGRLGRNEWDADAAAFARADLNHDGVLSRAEFLDVVRDPPAGVRQNTSNAYRAGYDRGLAEGRQAGKTARLANSGRWDLELQRAFQLADSGYRGDLGSRADYQSGYRAGFRVGYGEGFGPRR